MSDTQPVITFRPTALPWRIEISSHGDIIYHWRSDGVEHKANRLVDVPDEFRKVLHMRAMREGIHIVQSSVLGDRKCTPIEENIRLTFTPQTHNNRKLSLINLMRLIEIQLKRNQRWGEPRPQVGDCIKFSDGNLGVVAHSCDQFIQPSMHHGGRSCHIDDDGRASYSGGLSIPLAPEAFEPMFAGVVHMWFFDEGIAGARRGIDVDVRVRAWYLDLPRDYKTGDIKPDMQPKFDKG